LKILLADDDAVSRLILERALVRSGFEVVCVQDGQSAADCLLAPDGPRMAILDWVMPGKDGPTVCREVRACTAVPYVYLMLLTSKEETGDVITGLEAGADDYLTKPFNPEELKARLRSGQRILNLQDKLVHEAQHDPLTQLPNRAFFVKRLAECVRKSRESRAFQFTLLFVDIDRFKLINDSLGHATGDELMKGVADRLLQAVRSETIPCDQTEHRRRSGRPFDSVARIGGDEFVILLDDFADLDDGVRVAERIELILKEPFLIDGHTIFITVSIGISASNQRPQNSHDDLDPEEILRSADSAMYRAKLLGKARYAISDATESTRTRSLFKLETDLRSAIANKQFEVHYQPIVDLADSRIVSFEALVRWRHPQRGLIHPDDFIATAEENGMILAIGSLVLRDACHQAKRWNPVATTRPASICVNISPRQFQMLDLVASVREMLLESALEPHLLELEVTENMTMQDADRASQILLEMHKMGISLSLDDFGTGYSSLSYLQHFPICTLKIDRSFIARIDSHPESSQIVETIITLGHNLGMKVIAEGVETRSQMELLRRLHCDFGQGYLFSCALPVDQATKLLEDNRQGKPLIPNNRPCGQAALPISLSAAS